MAVAFSLSRFFNKRAAADIPKKESAFASKPTWADKMRPILLKGHDGPLTCVKYNKDGDLLFTTCKRGRICLWYSDDGERIGTYNKHNGAVMYVDVSCEYPTYLFAILECIKF